MIQSGEVISVTSATEPSNVKKDILLELVRVQQEYLSYLINILLESFIMK